MRIYKEIALQELLSRIFNIQMSRRSGQSGIDREQSASLSGKVHPTKKREPRALRALPSCSTPKSHDFVIQRFLFLLQLRNVVATASRLTAARKVFEDP
jgi:hypothetical protein